MQRKNVKKNQGAPKQAPRVMSGRRSTATMSKDLKKFKKGIVHDIIKGLAEAGGDVLGDLADTAISGAASLVGFGAYKTIPAPELNTVVGYKDGVPHIKNPERTMGEGVHVCKSEYVGELVTGGGTPTTFDLQRYDINPGNPALFPWLSQIAPYWEEYELNGAAVILKSEASNTATALSLGTYFGAVQYNQQDPPFQNKSELENYRYAESAKPTKDILIPIECKRIQDVLTHLYVAPNGVVPQGTDPRFAYLGSLYLGSQGNPTANTDIAEIWVTYDITFFKEKLTNGGALQLQNGYAHLVLTDPTAAVPFGEFLSLADTIGISVDPTGKEIIFPSSPIQNCYDIWMTFSGGTSALPTWAPSVLGGTLIKKFRYNGSIDNATHEEVPQGNPDDSGLLATSFQSAASVAPVFTPGITSMPTGTPYGDVYIYRTSNQPV